MEIRLDIVFAYVMHVTSHGDESDDSAKSGSQREVPTRTASE
jgi:hypothetical protein